VTEHLVATQSKLGVGVLGQAVADFGEFVDEGVDGHMVRNVDEFFDASTHS